MSTDAIHTTWNLLENGSQVELDTSWETVFQWFQEVDCFPKLIWKGRESSTVYLCIGQGERQPDLPCFTVRAFDSSQPQWHGFPNKLHWTPFGILEWKGKTNILCKNTTQKHWKQLDGHIQKHRVHLPSFADWKANIETSKQLFQDTTLRKIVLARESHFPFPNPWKSWMELAQLQPNNYHFLFSPNQQSVLIGSSPEKLFSQTGNILKTEALAGTRSVSNNNMENDALVQELHRSQKDQTEHHFVVHYIHQQLKDLCLEQQTLPQEVLQQTHVQHLRTPIECILDPNTTTAQLLDRLHPTPAVCGIPKILANRTIADLEPFHRGWYAGTMGIEHLGNADFTVMIRSALWRNGDGYAWSGAGIVADSDAELEWIEIQNKAKQFLKEDSF